MADFEDSEIDGVTACEIVPTLMAWNDSSRVTIKFSCHSDTAIQQIDTLMQLLQELKEQLVVECEE